MDVLFLHGLEPAIVGGLVEEAVREAVDAGREEVERPGVAERVPDCDEPALVGGIDDGLLDVQRRSGEVRHGEGVAQLVHELYVRRAAIVDL